MLKEDVSELQVFNTRTRDRTKSRPTCCIGHRLRTAGKMNVKPDRGVGNRQTSMITTHSSLLLIRICPSRL